MPRQINTPSIDEHSFNTPLISKTKSYHSFDWTKQSLITPLIKVKWNLDP